MKYYSSGKILLTGEYLVLKGAKALALPTKKGQLLKVSNHEKPQQIWQAFDPKGEIWFESFFSLDLNKIEKTTDMNAAKLLQYILKFIQIEKPNTFNKALKFENFLEFDKHWGLGSSSTLINNLHQWSGVDAYDLLKNSFGGSGYDLAVAQEKKSLIYQIINRKPYWETIDFKENFHKNLYFIYLNKKQNSRNEIANFKKAKVFEKDIRNINQITENLLYINSIEEFSKLMNKHEEIISHILNRPTIKQELFPDFRGSVKSLGAWGGDFVLAWGENTLEYFQQKGYPVVFKYSDFILQ